MEICVGVNISWLTLATQTTVTNLCSDSTGVVWYLDEPEDRTKRRKSKCLRTPAERDLCWLYEPGKRTGSWYSPDGPVTTCFRIERRVLSVIIRDIAYTVRFVNSADIVLLDKRTLRYAEMDAEEDEVAFVHHDPLRKYEQDMEQARSTTHAN
jgi:hypothetical protein